MLTQERLKDLFDYDADTGVFCRKLNSGFAKAGPINTLNKGKVYFEICIDGKHYRVHRLAWLYVYGEFPKYSVDHINGNKLDNNLSNLRDISIRENMQNKVRHRNGRLVGACFNKKNNKYSAIAHIEGRSRYFGTYSTELEAHEAYKTALAKLG